MYQIGRILSILYRNETIIDILGMAVEKGWTICFIEGGSPRPLKIDQIMDIRKSPEIYVTLGPAPVFRNSLGGETYGMAPFKKVELADLVVDDHTLALIQQVFGSGDKRFGSEIPGYKIDPLTLKEIEIRKTEIMQQSMEKRGPAINERAQKIFIELNQRYPKVRFDRDDVALLIMHEEQPIYDSLQKEMPNQKTYVKPIQAFKPAKKAGYSVPT